MEKFNKKAVFAALMGALSSVSSLAMESKHSEVENNAEGRFEGPFRKVDVDDLVEIWYVEEPPVLSAEEMEMLFKPPNYKELKELKDDKLKREFRELHRKTIIAGKARATTGYHRVLTNQLTKAVKNVLADPRYRAIAKLHKKVFGKLIIYQRPWSFVDTPFRFIPANKNSLTGLLSTMRPGFPDKSVPYVAEKARGCAIRFGWHDLANTLWYCTHSTAAKPDPSLVEWFSTGNIAAIRKVLQSKEKNDPVAFTRAYLPMLFEMSLKHEMGHVCDFVLSEIHRGTTDLRQPHHLLMPRVFVSTKYGAPVKTRVWNKDLRFRVVKLPEDLGTVDPSGDLTKHQFRVFAEAYAEALTIALNEKDFPKPLYQDKDGNLNNGLCEWGNNIINMVNSELAK